jgi:hypothetical protein
MRDPFENKALPLFLRYSLPLDPDQLPLREAEDLLGAMRDRVKVVSFTMDASGYDTPQVEAFGRGYSRPRMWEQYADNHSGVCLAFGAPRVLDNFYSAVKRHGAAQCGPVTYTEAGFVVSPGRVIDSQGLTIDNAAARLTAHLTSHNRDFFFLKLLDWHSEFEYRMIVFAPTIPPSATIDVSFGDCLEAVIVGELFPDADLPEIVSAAATYGVPVQRMTWDTGRPIAKDI